MHREPRSFFAFCGGLHLLHRRRGDLSICPTIEGCAWLASLFENALVDPNINTGVRLGVFGFENDSNLAVAKTLPFINQQSKTLWIALCPQSAVVHNEPAPAHMHPIRIQFP